MSSTPFVIPASETDLNALLVERMRPRGVGGAVVALEVLHQRVSTGAAALPHRQLGLATAT